MELCGKPRLYREWCGGHYARWQKYGSPIGGPAAAQTVEGAHEDSSDFWRPIPAFPGYEASADGQIRSIGRWVTGSDGVRKWFFGRVLKPQRNKRHERLYVKVGSTRSVHVLVAAAFLGARPDGLHVCHNDGDAFNNRVSNLRYDTPAANSRDVVAHGRNRCANKTECKRGHPLVGPLADVYVGPTGSRQCRPCVVLMSRVRRARKAAG